MLSNFLKWCHSGTSVTVGLPAILLPLLNRGGLEPRDRRQHLFTLTGRYVHLNHLNLIMFITFDRVHHSLFGDAMTREF